MGEERSKEMKVIIIVSGDSEVHLLFVKFFKSSCRETDGRKKERLDLGPFIYGKGGTFCTQVCGGLKCLQQKMGCRSYRGENDSCSPQGKLGRVVSEEENIIPVSKKRRAERYGSVLLRRVCVQGASAG